MSANFLVPETDKMFQFLGPETDINLQFLAPENVEMGHQNLNFDKSKTATPPGEDKKDECGC